MRLGKKAMASTIDAFMFITIITLIAAGMFAYSSVPEDKETLAKTAYDAFFDTKLKANDMFEDTDTQNVRMCDLVAAYMVTGEGDVIAYAEDVMRASISPVHSYLLTVEYKGRTLTIGPGGDVLSSRYSSEMTVSDGNIMRASLSVY